MLALLCGVSLGAPALSFAQDEDAPAPVKPAGDAAPANDGKAVKKEEKVKTGIIANSGSIGSGAVSVSTDGSSPGDEPNPISGSVSVAARGKCIASVTNASKTSTYAVRFAVEARNSSGASTLNKSFNATLAPKATVTKDFNCRENDNMQVVLKSANKR